mmetsp:Transcript_38369/g.91669  ORF Transcript_38369/g.91669 Transcript_38369/m.91669 type:complete len:202 (+) Transcript_38369:528-1133(+)
MHHVRPRRSPLCARRPSAAAGLAAHGVLQEPHRGGGHGRLRAKAGRSHLRPLPGTLLSALLVGGRGGFLDARRAGRLQEALALGAGQRLHRLPAECAHRSDSEEALRVGLRDHRCRQGHGHRIFFRAGFRRPHLPSAADRVLRDHRRGADVEPPEAPGAGRAAAGRAAAAGQGHKEEQRQEIGTEIRPGETRPPVFPMAAI